VLNDVVLVVDKGNFLAEHRIREPGLSKHTTQQGQWRVFPAIWRLEPCHKQKRRADLENSAGLDHGIAYRTHIHFAVPLQ
jgi:hypothetical protein